MIQYNFVRNPKLVGYGSLRESSANVVTEPITLNEAKAHLRIDNSFTADDTYINTLISVSRNICENYVGFILGHNTKLHYYLDAFPDSEVIYLYGVANLSSITIHYEDQNGNNQLLSNTYYNIDTNSIPSRIFLIDTAIIPDTSDNIPSAVNITIDAGPLAEYQLPKSLYQAILLTIGSLYENRQNVVVGGGKGYEIPQTAEYLMNAFRVINI